MESLQLLIEQAFEVGEKTGLARKQHDEARAKFHKDWFNRFLSLHDADKVQLREAFDNGYRAGYGDMDPVRLWNQTGRR